MPSISATIITRNEAESIARAIRSAGMADEVLVVDAESADETRQIAASMGARVLIEPWKGFAAQKNFAARAAKNDWILSLDADEEFDSQAQEAIRKWKVSEPDAEGYRFRRRARYLGRWIRHSGWYPDYKVRLYHRNCGEWVGAYVHESAVVKGRVATLPGEIRHYTCDSIEDHRKRIEFYTGLAAAQMIEQGKTAGRVRRIFAPPWAFAKAYFFQLGLLDGVEGFWIARMAGHYVARKNAKWAELVAEKHRARKS